MNIIPNKAEQALQRLEQRQRTVDLEGYVTHFDPKDCMIFMDIRGKDEIFTCSPVLYGNIALRFNIGDYLSIEVYQYVIKSVARKLPPFLR